MTKHLSGFLNYFESEAISGALPKDRNSPQIAPMGLYAEQVNNSAFTAPRSQNFKAWLYKILPSVKQSGISQEVHDSLIRGYKNQDVVSGFPDQLRWNPIEFSKVDVDFVHGMVTMAYNEVATVHMYYCDTSMDSNYFYNADGDWIVVPQSGVIEFKTEMGVLEVRPGEVIVIPRGIKYQVKLLDGSSAFGYICEVNSSYFNLPERGVIGANCLAEERHFLAPVASYEDKSGSFELYAKYGDRLWRMDITNSPIDVVAWHGDLYPYKYDLDLFCPINSVLRDHPDPSIFTVLTAASARPGWADIDFVIFPPRWVTAENTFRPPYYHRNVMSEFMGLIFGQYDAKVSGFLPGGSSIHNCMSPHGVDSDVFGLSSKEDTSKPVRYKDTLAFMFESRSVWIPTTFALNNIARQESYIDCWKGLKKKFKY